MNITESPREALTSIAVDELIERCLGKIDFAQRILSKLQEYFGEGLEELEENIRTQNAEGTALVAHRLKGAAANAAASSLQTSAAEIENLARTGNLNNITPHLQQLRDDWNQLSKEIELFDIETFATGA